MARVIIPKTAEKMLALSKLVYGKHQADGANSPLNALQDFNWTDNGPKVAQAEVLLNGVPSGLYLLQVAVSMARTSGQVIQLPKYGWKTYNPACICCE